MIIEVDNGHGWKQAGVLTAADPEPSITANRLDGRRDVILFRCHGDYSVIRTSTAGTDYEAGALRVISPLAGFEELARLGPGESFERTVTSDRGFTYTARWRHVA